MGPGLDWVDIYNVSDGLIVFVRVIPCHMCETYLSKKDVGFHADVLCEGYKSVSLVTAHLLQQRTLSLCLNLCTSHTLNPPLFLCASQVWYLSGWVCYLQLERAKEQQERDGGEAAEEEKEEEKEERKALRDAARSYLTNAKKVMRVQISSLYIEPYCFWYSYLTCFAPPQ